MAFFMLGLFNNLGYVVIGTAAADLAQKFGYDDLMSSFNLALVTFSVITKFVNSWLLLKVSHKLKIMITGAGWCIGFALVVISEQFADETPGAERNSSNTWGFILALVGSTITGCFVGLGDCTLLGFMKVYPAIVVSGYASGTGGAGVAGSMYYLLMSGVFGLDLTWVFSP
jgi:battenin